MPSYTTADIRNILLAGHGGSGKTTLADALLLASGTVNRKTSVPDGSSFSDFEKEEKEHKHSIYSAILHADHQGKRINLIDSPGSPDLIGAAIACLPAVETVAVVINAPSGIEVVTRRIWRPPRRRTFRARSSSTRSTCPRSIWKPLVEQIQRNLRHRMPADQSPRRQAARKSSNACSSTEGESDFDTVKRCHAAILDQIVEMDENLMEKYLGGEEPDYAALHVAVREGDG